MPRIQKGFSKGDIENAILVSLENRLSVSPSFEELFRFVSESFAGSPEGEIERGAFGRVLSSLGARGLVFRGSDGRYSITPEGKSYWSDQSIKGDYRW